MGADRTQFNGVAYFPAPKLRDRASTIALRVFIRVIRVIDGSISEFGFNSDSALGIRG